MIRLYNCCPCAYTPSTMNIHTGGGLFTPLQLKKYSTAKHGRSQALLCLTAVFSSFFLLLITISCSPSLNISVKEDLSAGIVFSTQTSAAVENTIRGLLGIQENTYLFSSTAIAETLSSTGISVISSTFPSPASVSIAGSTADILSSFSNADNAASLTQKNGTKTMNITIGPQVIAKLIHYMPPETAEYLELLMAPVFTGEIMDSDEYIDLLSSIYGKNIGEEMNKANLFITFTAPSKVINAEITDQTAGVVSFSKNTAYFVLPMHKLLTLSNNTIFSITW